MVADRCIQQSAHAVRRTSNIGDAQGVREGKQEVWTKAAHHILVV
jgi:hypothetical protein